MIVVEMKKHFQLRALEWWSAAAMTSWGFMTLAIPDMFRQNPATQELLTLAPQHIWGLVAFLAGFVRICALFVNGLWYRTPAVRWACSMISTFVWFWVCTAFLKSPVANVGVAVYAWAMVADMYSAFRSASDYIEAAAQAHLKKLTVAEVPPRSEGDNVRSISAR